MAVPAPWEKNNSDLLLCLLLNRKHVTCTALWTLHMNRTDETSCFEKSAFIHQVTFLLISNLTLFLWNSTFPFPRLANFSFSQYRELRVSGKLWSARSKRRYLCISGACRVARCPAPAKLGSRRPAAPGGGGGWSLSLLQRERGPGRGPCYLTRSLTQHRAAISSHRTMPDRAASMWQPVLLNSLQNNLGTPPRCRHVVQSWDFVQVFIGTQAQVLLQLSARKTRWGKARSQVFSLLDRIKKAKRTRDESMVAFSPQENYICFLRTSNDSFQSCG